jgi:hypothetical protein
MKKNEDFQLVGHLQVMDEPLSSLYIDKVSGLLYLFVRVFEDTNIGTFVLTVVSPLQIVDYMEGRVGLRGIFSNTKSYYYQHQNDVLSASDFKLLPPDKVDEKLESDGLDDKFDRHLSYRMVPLKQYLKKMSC